MGHWPSLSCPRLQASGESGAPCPCLEQDAHGQAHPLQETPPPTPQLPLKVDLTTVRSGQPGSSPKWESMGGGGEAGGV